MACSHTRCLSRSSRSAKAFILHRHHRFRPARASTECSRRPQDSRSSWTAQPSRTTPEQWNCSKAVFPAHWPLQPGRLAMAGGQGSAATATFRSLAGATGRPADLRPTIAGLQQRNSGTAHSERTMDSDRQRKSRAWVRSVACGSQRKPDCSSFNCRGLSLGSMACGCPQMASQSCCG